MWSELVSFLGLSFKTKKVKVLINLKIYFVWNGKALVLSPGASRSGAQSPEDPVPSVGVMMSYPFPPLLSLPLHPWPLPNRETSRLCATAPPAGRYAPDRDSDTLSLSHSWSESGAKSGLFPTGLQLCNRLWVRKRAPLIFNRIFPEKKCPGSAEWVRELPNWTHKSLGHPKADSGD